MTVDDDTRRAIRSAAREALAIRSLGEFVSVAWPVVEPAVPLTWNWHLDVLCYELERVERDYAEGRACEVVIAIPPGYMKSLLVSVFWPAWSWLRDPARRAMFLANADDLVKRDSRRTRDLITSDVYAALKARASQSWTFKADQNEVINFGNTAGGFRQCLSIGATVTGKRADMQVIDDPYDAKEVILGSTAQVARRMREVIDIYNGVLSSRLNDRRRAARVLIMQRLHAADLAGYLLDRGARAVVLPTEFDPDSPHVHPLDPRGGDDALARYVATFGRAYTGPRGRGALLFPERFDARIVNEIRSSLGPRHYSAQEQQRPIVAEGSIFKRAHLERRYTFDAQRSHFDEIAIFVDATFRKTEGSDYVAAQVWGRRGTSRYLLDQRRARMTYTETRSALIALRAKWPAARSTVIEAKANGDALLDDLRGTMTGLIAFDPGNVSKEARAQLAAVDFEAGAVYLPTVQAAPWIADFERELLEFPGGLHDDQVDACSMALLRWSQVATKSPAREFGFLFKCAN